MHATQPDNSHCFLVMDVISLALSLCPPSVVQSPGDTGNRYDRAPSPCLLSTYLSNECCSYADSVESDPRWKWRRCFCRTNFFLRAGLKFADVFPKSILVGPVYRRRPCASVMTPAPTTTKTMTMASASAKPMVSYQLFQSSSMRWPLSKARPALRRDHYVERTCLS